MIQAAFAEKATRILEADDQVIGLAVAGSWLTHELDAYSDLDLVLVTRTKIAHDKSKMLHYAHRLGQLLSGFTGEHVGEPRLLICLYDNPLLHVDIKFVTLEEFHLRVEQPQVLLDTDGRLQQVLDQTPYQFPYPDLQWIEDRFWIWIHYALLKIGRGEYLEAVDFLGYLRQVVLGPLLHLKHNSLPRGVRKLETLLPPEDLEALQSTIAAYSRDSLLHSLKEAVILYKRLRKEVYPTEIRWHHRTEQKVMEYFHITGK